MTVHVLNTPLQLPTPELAVVHARRTELTRNAQDLSHFYLEHIPIKLTSLLKELGQVDQAALNLITLGPELLRPNGFSVLIKDLGQLRQNPEKEQDGTIAEVVAEIDSMLQVSSTGLNDYAQTLDHALINFKAVSFGDIDALPAAIMARTGIAGTRIAIIAASREKLLEEQAALKTLIDNLEALNVFDKLKPVVESMKSLADIDPKNPLVGSIKSGIDIFSSLLGLAGDALRYEHLIERRTRLHADLDSNTQESLELSVSRDKDNKDLNDIKLLQGMQALRNDYTLEVGKLLEALKQFKASVFNEADSPEQRVSSFTQYAGMLTAYLDDLRRDWQS